MKKNGLNLGLVVIFFIIASMACSSNTGRTTAEPKPKKNSFPTVLVQKGSGGSVGVYQQDLVIYPAVMVDGKPVAGDHSFTLFSTDTYKGKTPNCDQKTLSLSISHSVPEQGAWRFPPSTKASVTIDGVALPLTVYSQLPYALPAMADHMKDPEASEAVIIAATCDMYKLMSKAKSVTFQIGDASFDIDGATISNFREFAGDIGYK